MNTVRIYFHKHDSAADLCTIATMATFTSNAAAPQYSCSYKMRLVVVRRYCPKSINVSPLLTPASHGPWRSNVASSSHWCSRHRLTLSRPTNQSGDGCMKATEDTTWWYLLAKKREREAEEREAEERERLSSFCATMEPLTGTLEKFPIHLPLGKVRQYLAKYSENEGIRSHSEDMTRNNMTHLSTSILVSTVPTPAPSGSVLNAVRLSILDVVSSSRRVGTRTFAMLCIPEEARLPVAGNTPDSTGLG